MRQVVLDTETTGIDPKKGHKIIEIGCVELENRRLTGRHYHVYINPQREIEQEAIDVHGITNEQVADKPLFRDIAVEFLDFIKGSQLVIHNAPFDIGFMDHEFNQLASPPIKATADVCGILDSLTLARDLHPGQKNNLDALCRRYGIDNSHRILHGALLDAEILADVYLLMTGGQTKLNLKGESDSVSAGGITRVSSARQPFKVIQATADELVEHTTRLDVITKESGQCIWNKI